MSDGRIGNSNQNLQISGVVSAPAYSFASDNDSGMYRIGANNIGLCVNGANVLNIATTGLGVTGAATGTSTSANALAVGRQGTTNPVLNVDASTASVVTGLNVKGAAAAAGLALSVTSSGTNEDIFIDPKGNGGIILCNNSTGYVEVRQTTNGSVASYVRNNSTGTAAYSTLSVVSSTGVSGDFRQNGSSFTTSGIYQQNGTMLVGGGAGGLTVGTTANQPVYFAQNSAEKARIGTDGSFLVGTTTNAGAGNISAFSIISGRVSINGGSATTSGTWYNVVLISSLKTGITKFFANADQNGYSGAYEIYIDSSSNVVANAGGTWKQNTNGCVFQSNGTYIQVQQNVNNAAILAVSWTTLASI